jgi:hypothetical protein
LAFNSVDPAFNYLHQDVNWYCAMIKHLIVEFSRVNVFAQLLSRMDTQFLDFELTHYYPLQPL